MYAVIHRQHHRVQYGLWLLVCGYESNVRWRRSQSMRFQHLIYVMQPWNELRWRRRSALFECFSSLSFFFFHHLPKCHRSAESEMMWKWNALQAKVCKNTLIEHWRQRAHSGALASLPASCRRRRILGIQRKWTAGAEGLSHSATQL